MCSISRSTTPLRIVSVSLSLSLSSNEFLSSVLPSHQKLSKSVDSNLSTNEPCRTEGEQKKKEKKKKMRSNKQKQYLCYTTRIWRLVSTEHTHTLAFTLIDANIHKLIANQPSIYPSIRHNIPFVCNIIRKSSIIFFSSSSSFCLFCFGTFPAIGILLCVLHIIIIILRLLVSCTTFRFLFIAPIFFYCHGIATAAVAAVTSAQ